MPASFAESVQRQHTADRLAGERLVDAVGIPPEVNGAPLSLREREVLALIAAGHSNAVIARELYIAEETVKTHVRRVLARTGAANRAHLIALALTKTQIEVLLKADFAA